jgi:transcriptional regulator with XRE-family HTH domain
MPSPSSSQQDARARLGKRLRALRDEAGLSNAELSVLCGWSIAKTSRLERGRQTASAGDVRAWCAATGRTEELTDLLAAAQAAEELYEAYRASSLYLKRRQERVNASYEDARLVRIYSIELIPGLLQTPGYVHAVFDMIGRFRGWPPADTEAAIAVRLAGQRKLHDPRRRFVILLDEGLLWRRIGDAEVMREQLDALSAATRLPQLTLGVLPFARPFCTEVTPRESFYLYDSLMATQETIGAYIQIREPGEIRVYERAFLAYSQHAVYGGEARDVIARAAGSLA